MENQEGYIKVTRAVARWLIEYAKQLVNDGYGTDYDPYNPEIDLNPVNSGFIDEIPMDNGEMWRFVNALINFARTVAGILAKQMGDPISPLTLEDLEIGEEEF